MEIHARNVAWLAVGSLLVLLVLGGCAPEGGARLDPNAITFELTDDDAGVAPDEDVPADGSRTRDALAACATPDECAVAYLDHMSELRSALSGVNERPTLEGWLDSFASYDPLVAAGDTIHVSTLDGAVDGLVTGLTDVTDSVREELSDAQLSELDHYGIHYEAAEITLFGDAGVVSTSMLLIARERDIPGHADAPTMRMLPIVMATATDHAETLADCSTTASDYACGPFTGRCDPDCTTPMTGHILDSACYSRWTDIACNDYRAAMVIACNRYSAAQSACMSNLLAANAITVALLAVRTLACSPLLLVPFIGAGLFSWCVNNAAAAAAATAIATGLMYWACMSNASTAFATDQSNAGVTRDAAVANASVRCCTIACPIPTTPAPPRDGGVPNPDRGH